MLHKGPGREERGEVITRDRKTMEGRRMLNRKEREGKEEMGSNGEVKYRMGKNEVGSGRNGLREGPRGRNRRRF